MKTVLVALLAISLISSGLVQGVSAQVPAGGVNKPGSWFVGEGLKKGDQFSYSLCHVYYKECTKFQIDFWVEGDQQGNELFQLARAAENEECDPVDDPFGGHPFVLSNGADFDHE